VHLTWSFVPDGLSIPANGQIATETTSPSVLFSRMDSLFASAGGRAIWIAQIQKCFDRWSALSGVKYTRVTDGVDDWDDGAAWGASGGATRGDIRISMHNIDGVNGVLAYDSFPTTSDMVLDSSENWAQGAPSYTFLRNVVTHEHGHGLGFSHVCPANGTKLMEPFIYTGYDGPQQDDIRAIDYNYGDAYEPNNSAATAYDLGTRGSGSSTTLGGISAPSVFSAADLAISNSTDVDYFKFTLSAPALVDFTATPVGTTYAMYTQDSACNNTVANDNALTAADLVLTAYNANGTTVLRTQNATGAGSAEAISGLLMSSGTNYIKVSPNGPVSEAQLYQLLISVRGTNLAPTSSDGTYSDHVHISWPAISDASSYQVYRNTADATFGGTTLATVTPPTTTYDDSTATPGTSYYYFVKVQQPGNTGYRFMTDSGNTGFADAPPTANAGPDQTVIDVDNSGSEPVTLDGSASSHIGPGSINTYNWTEGPTLLAQSSSPTSVVSLAVGTHTVTLIVTDSYGFQGTDTVTINVVPPQKCGSADFNCDGDIATDADIEAFFACIAGTCPPPPCTSTADFNGDGDFATDADIEAFFRVLAGGTC
jgi:hypothetical protein